MTCEGYTLVGTGLQFCDKNSARAVAAVSEECEVRGSLICALAFEHQWQNHIPENFGTPDEDGWPEEWLACDPGACVFCDAERAHPVRK